MFLKVCIRSKENIRAQIPLLEKNPQLLEIGQKINIFSTFQINVQQYQASRDPLLVVIIVIFEWLADIERLMS